MSKFDRALAFAFNHQTVIIELIFAIILSIVVVWLFTHLRGEAGEPTQGTDLKDIEHALKRVLESTDLKVTAAQAVQHIKDDEDDVLAPPVAKTGPPGAAAPGSGTDQVELSRLRIEMETKNKKIAEVEQALSQAKAELTKVQSSSTVAAAGAPGAPGVNTDELQAKIKSLESRLAEYEIIEDDIANLSLYKEENTKLKADLEKIKKGSGGWDSSVSSAPAGAVTSVSAPTPSTPSAPSASAPPAPGPTMTTAAAPAAGQNPGATAPGPTKPDEAPIDSDKLLKEFDALVSGGAPAPAAAAPAAAAASPSANKTATADEAATGDKLIEEFENFVKGSGS